MSYSAQSIKNTKVIAQGEDYPIFVRLLPSTSEGLIDKVWAETDEGFTSTIVKHPPYSETIQLIFYSAVTSQFYPDRHHVRVWIEENGLKTVALEFMIQVNPAFPFDADTVNKDYEYTGTANEYTVVSSTAETVTDTVKQARLNTVAQWSKATFRVETYEELPIEAVQIGDCGIVTGTSPVQYFTCTNTNPVIWTRYGVDEFEGSVPALVPTSTGETQNLYLKGDGTWSVIDRTSIDTHNLIVTDEDFVLIDCQPEY